MSTSTTLLNRIVGSLLILLTTLTLSAQSGSAEIRIIDITDPQTVKVTTTAVEGNPMIMAGNKIRFYTKEQFELMLKFECQLDGKTITPANMEKAQYQLKIDKHDEHYKIESIDASAKHAGEVLVKGSVTDKQTLTGQFKVLLSDASGKTVMEFPFSFLILPKTQNPSSSTTYLEYKDSIPIAKY
ncbi:hypothetical protein CRP01_15405 [Flavilitoribacter nigricans DSM 23189 = NBRC 102662]|uniref:Uncharacterized protein n=1 Tax=Flavilitoribacter nigricans (strain ATCC 23147 / DSM 23189 / NBRC 102662 / NCIMB 1420 / SS-2) TaxID=1122177 RepID=A0A2D0NBJ3_FLAN2|nr:hypothetical protein CRP01_15405 [Flavilitoribacter nigricans DSM 23189 = NBRC 102662]